MQSSTKTHFIGGFVCIILGLLLMLFTTDIETPVITLSKVGVVLLVIGLLDAAYGVYLLLKRK